MKYKSIQVLAAYSADQVEDSQCVEVRECDTVKCYSEFASGPNLCHLAEVAGHLFGAGFYGIESCRALGWRV